MLKQFWLDARGSALEKYAVGGLVVTLGGFFLGQAFDQYASNNDFFSLAFLEPGLSAPVKTKPSKFNSVDMATTGSIRGQVVVIDPCTGQQKN